MQFQSLEVIFLCHPKVITTLLMVRGYPNAPGLLTPYRGERYHLNDFRGQGRIRNKQALFNCRYSSLRNVIERCFGLLKARFPILKSINGYPSIRQRQIPLACCAFIISFGWKIGMIN